MRRSRPRSPERLAAVPAPRPSPEQLVLRATWRIGGEPGADARDRSPVHQAAIHRHPQDPQTFPNQPQASPAAHAASGTRGSMPQAINQPSGIRPQDLPVFTAESADRQARSGMGQRHHVHPDAAWLPLPHGGHGSLQPERPFVETLEHPHWRFLHRRARRGAVPIPPRDLQHGSGGPVHGDGLHEPIGKSWRRYLDGRPGPGPGQRLRRAAVAVGQVRGGLPAKKYLRRYFDYYRNDRIHQALGYRTPAVVYAGG